ncbi:hypothetical protein [Streptomyces sp. TLI_105]|uniref:hypothetical protein n=1 Tax=Streptomyces sp. TLI_105 TaxID=1881019 RepID=UPI00115F7E95|nr:hypothetical protein [Streptomyces sp. TLI_105]
MRAAAGARGGRGGVGQALGGGGFGGRREHGGQVGEPAQDAVALLGEGADRPVRAVGEDVGDGRTDLRELGRLDGRAGPGVGEQGVGLGPGVGHDRPGGGEQRVRLGPAVGHQRAGPASPRSWATVVCRPGSSAAARISRRKRMRTSSFPMPRLP